MINSIIGKLIWILNKINLQLPIIKEVNPKHLSCFRKCLLMIISDMQRLFNKLGLFKLWVCTLLCAISHVAVSLYIIRLDTDSVTSFNPEVGPTVINTDSISWYDLSSKSECANYITVSALMMSDDDITVCLPDSYVFSQAHALIGCCWCYESAGFSN